VKALALGRKQKAYILPTKNGMFLSWGQNHSQSQ
jgi:hypothetical protein